MPSRFWDFEPRRPRHQASTAATTVLVRRMGGSQRDWVEAELGDIARNGVRLLGPPPMEVDDRIEISIPFDDARLNKCLAASVRWCRTDEGQVEMACELDVPLDWELIGELILRGALSARPETESWH